MKAPSFSHQCGPFFLIFFFFLAIPLPTGRHSVPGDIMLYPWRPFGGFTDTCGKAAAILATPVLRAASFAPSSHLLAFPLFTLFCFSSHRIIAWQLPFRSEIMPRKKKEESVSSLCCFPSEKRDHWNSSIAFSVAETKQGHKMSPTFHRASWSSELCHHTSKHLRNQVTLGTRQWTILHYTFPGLEVYVSLAWDFGSQAF